MEVEATPVTEKIQFILNSLSQLHVSSNPTALKPALSRGILTEDPSRAKYTLIKSHMTYLGTHFFYLIQSGYFLGDFCT